MIVEHSGIQGLSILAIPNLQSVFFIWLMFPKREVVQIGGQLRRIGHDPTGMREENKDVFKSLQHVSTKANSQASTAMRQQMIYKIHMFIGPYFELERKSIYVSVFLCHLEMWLFPLQICHPKAEWIWHEGLVVLRQYKQKQIGYKEHVTVCFCLICYQWRLWRLWIANEV